MADGNRNHLETLTALLVRRHGVSASAGAAIADLPHSVRDYEPGQYLLREGDIVRHCSFLMSGFVFRHKIVGDGGRQIVGIHLAGDLIDLQNILLGSSDHNIQALTPVTVAVVPTAALIELAFSDPQIGRMLWTESLIEAALFREWVTNIGRRDARSRTAHLLCELALRQENAGLGARGDFELPMTQEQLGDALGLTAVHVNRTLKTLQGQGLIERSKRAVMIADWAGLSEAGDFTTSYLHLRSNLPC